MSINQKFKKIKNSKNPETINDFIISLTKSPLEDHLKFINYFIENLPENLLNKIKINLVYLIGLLSQKVNLEDNYLKFLKKQYYNSDRWIRNEIVKALCEIVKNQKLSDQYMVLISNSLKEDYIPIVINALEALWNCEGLSNIYLKNILIIIDSESSQVVEKARKILKREIKSYNELFELLNNENNYEMLNKTRFRTILLTFFDSIFALEDFKVLIISSDWFETYKKPFIQELETFEKILLNK